MVKKAKERVERLHRMKRAKEKGSYRSSTLMALIPKRRKHNMYIMMNIMKAQADAACKDICKKQ
jgi:predicted CopG family antitoxin